MSLYGADVEQLDALAKTMAEVAQLAGSAAQNIQRSLQEVAWMGPDADRFRHEWSGHQNRINAATSTLGSLARTLRSQAQSQREISTGGASSGASAAGPVSAGQGGETGLLGGAAAATGAFGAAATAGGIASDMASGGIASASGVLNAGGNTAGNQTAPLPQGVPNDLSDLTSLSSSTFGKSYSDLLPKVLSGDATVADLKPTAAAVLSGFGDHQVSGSTEVSGGGSWSMHDVGSASWGQYSVDGELSVGYEGNLSGHAGMQDGQLQAGFEAGARLGGYAEASGEASALGFATVGAHGEAMLGAETGARGDMSLGSEGLQGTLGAEAFAGARAGGEGTLGLGEGGSGTIGGEVWAGAGVKLDGDISIGMDGIGGDIDLGMAFGYGGHLKLGFRADPIGAIGDIGGGVENVVDGVGSAVSSVASAFNPSGWF